MKTAKFYLARTKRLQAISVVILCLCYGLILRHGVSFASPPTENTNQLTTAVCGNQGLTSYADLLTQPLTGTVYVKLADNVKPGPISLYHEPILGGSCTLIGSTQAQSTNWTKVGSVNINGGSQQIVIKGPSLSAEPYASVAGLMNLTSPNVCQPTKGCQTSYDNNYGSLQPNLISGNTDEIAVYQATPLINTKLVDVDYYADNKYLYSSKKLSVINRNYLGGGIHSTLAQAYFINGEKLNVYQTINAGADDSASLYLKSKIYSYHFALVFFGAVALVVVILSLSLWIARRVYKRRQFIIEHGLDKYHDYIKKDDDEDKPGSPNVLVG